MAPCSSDGPSGDLIIAKAGALYGTTVRGGPGGSLGGLVVSGLRPYCTASRVPTETFPIN
jgi:hypothetical protein